jgi:hypothetical protein
MADFGAPVAQNVNPQQGIQTLSQLLGLQSTQQDIALKKNQQALQQQEIQRSQVQTQQDVGTNQFFSQWNPGDHHGDDGTLDIDSAHQSPAYQALPGVARIAVDAKLNGLKAQQLQNKQALTTLNGDVVGQFGKLAQALSTNGDPGEIKNQLTAFAQQGPDQARIAQIYGPMLQKVPPQNMGAALRTMGAQAQDVSAQQAQTNKLPGSIDTGGQILPTVTERRTGIQQPTGQAFNKTPAPAVTTLPSGSLGTVGGVYGIPPGAPGAGAPPPATKLQPLARPPANAPAADQANYQARIKAAGDEQQAVSQAANDPLNGTQATRFRNQQILDLIPHAATGPGMKLMNTIASRLPGASGDAYQDLEHYTAQNSAALAKLMGVPGTNLGAETAAAAAGNVERNPGALKEITKTNDALNTAFDLYNRGLAKVTSNGSDLSRAAAYKQAFGQNLDINAIRWADAHRRKDGEEVASLQAKAGPQGLADYGKKLNTLKALATTGDLP